MEEKYFPALVEEIIGDQVMVSGALQLVSIQSVRLRMRSQISLEEQDRKNNAAYHVHRPLLHALSSLPGNFTFSLNILTLPDPAYPLSGKVNMAILLSGTGSHRPAIIADFLSCYASLFSLLSNFLLHAEFEVVKDEDELRKWLTPFRPATVYMVDRHHRSFALTVAPQSRPENTIGFLSSAKNEEEVSAIRHMFPWCPSETSDLANIIEALLLWPSQILFQYRLRPATMQLEEVSRLKDSLATCEELMNGLQGKHSVLSLQTQQLRGAISERILQENLPAFLGACFVCSESELDETMVAAVAGQVSVVPPAHNLAMTLKGGSSIKKVAATKFLDRSYFSQSGVFTADEATCAFRIPHAEAIDPPGLPVKSFRTGLADAKVLQDCGAKKLLLGHNRHRGHINPVYASNEDRFRHTIIMGQTGTGKSVYLESLVLQDISNGQGCCFIDPHGDSIEKILQLFPPGRAEDLVLVDFHDPLRVVPFNILAWETAEERDRIIDSLYGWVDMTYDMRTSGGPIFEQYYRGFLRALLGDTPRTEFQPAISDLLRLFVDRKFRDYCVSSCNDESVQRMIRQATDAGGDSSLNNIAPYITSKLNRFELDANLRVMTGQDQMVLDFTKIMNEGKVLLVNMGRGRYGETVASLLASQIVSRLQSAALTRLRMKPGERRDFFLYIDEFQNVASEPFVAMLSEARKFRLGLVLANQYADQLESRKMSSGDSVLKAVLGNVGNTTCFRLGVKDAKTMDEVFHPHFKSEDLINLPVGTCYVNLKSNRGNPSSFSVETKYLEPPENEKFVETLKKKSNENYTIAVERAKEKMEARERRIKDTIAQYKGGR